ncbi:hypothetical protein [Chitinophaga sp. S165]|uniref:hypothetical protein n=1 Tax=Chitinophaga sp. S165 TaxID=2135462 RepID=UPI000D7138C0|nr:hypothetical protein [Chitinophaga sp. S165]PWV46214.1 hypothetical protein C7475_111117 [Chitinophaga sp. S165]
MRYPAYAAVILSGICLASGLLVSSLRSRGKEDWIRKAQLDSVKASSLQFLLDHSEGLLSYQPSIDSFLQDNPEQQLPFIVSHIVDAHEACGRRLGKGINREVFLNYVLPHKIFSERAENWRAAVRKEYKELPAVPDSSDYIRYTRKIVDDLKHWFRFSSKVGAVYSLTYSDLRNRGKGDCISESLLGVYTLRSLGVPVAMDFTCSFGNFDGSMHMWNSIVYNNHHSVPFMAAESYPMEYDPFAIVLDKSHPDLTTYKRCAKVFRRTYSLRSDGGNPVNSSLEMPEILKDNRFTDVTDSYLSVSDIRYSNRLKCLVRAPGYICVYNNDSWKPAYWSVTLREGSLLFPKMGRELLYMIAASNNGRIVPLSHPFILTKEGKIHQLDGKGNTISSLPIVSLASPIQMQMDTMARITDKHNFDKIMRNIATEKIVCKPVVGDEYTLAIWRDKWVIFQKQVCTSTGLYFQNVPTQGLYKILLPGSQGKATRVFTFDNSFWAQVWL